MKILACDTSTLLGSVALSDGDQILSSRSIQRAGSHSDTLNGMIDECLNESGLSYKDIDLFVTGLGPGSFTGIRISLNTIKTLAYTQNKPCVGVDSLFTIAEQHKNLSVPAISVMINAFKNMVYFAEYEAVEKKLKVIQPPQVVRVQELENSLNKESLILGDGYLAYEDYLKTHVSSNLKRPEKPNDFPIATTLCHLFTHKKTQDFADSKFHWSNLIPIYLRASEAEENLKGIKYQPLAMR